MNIIPQSSLLLGIIPALILLYISLKDWQDHYTEKTLFIMFILGIIIGFIVVLMSTFYDLLIIILIFPFLEQIIKTMILNLRRSQAKQATVMYGLGFGLGFGSIYPPAFLILFSQAEISNFILISTLLGSLGLLLIHGATGALIGYGIYQGKLLNFYFYSVLMLIGANLLMWIQVGYVQWITLLVGLFMFYLVHKKILLKVVRSFEKRKQNQKPSD
ncbi:MAG: protease PrsW [Thermoplasmatota archaeon]